MRTNLRSIRGPNWVEARVRATIVIEKTGDNGDDRRRDANEDLAGGVRPPLFTHDGSVMSPW